MTGVTLRPSDRAVWRALHGCPAHWSPLTAEGGFLPLHIAQVLGGRWTCQGIRIALGRLERHRMVKAMPEGRWVAKGTPS